MSAQLRVINCSTIKTSVIPVICQTFRPQPPDQSTAG